MNVWSEHGFGIYELNRSFGQRAIRENRHFGVTEVMEMRRVKRATVAPEKTGSMGNGSDGDETGEAGNGSKGKNGGLG